MKDALDRIYDMGRFWWTVGQLAADTHSVITMRVMGMSGAWLVPASENVDMVAEKAPAMTEAMVSGMMTALRGHGPDRVMQAMIEPISSKATANRQRLAECGPRNPLVPDASILPPVPEPLNADTNL